MNARILFVAAMLVAAVPAVANLTVVTRAHEVSLADLRLPQSTSGTLTFKPCEECDYKTIRVTRATQYATNEQVLELADFRRETGKIADRQRVAVTVLHHLGSDTITAVRASL